MEVQCCVCKKVRREGRWYLVAKAKLRGHEISHGYCPPCARSATAELRQRMYDPSRA